MGSERKRALRDEGDTGRLLGFCDGVFAIAITILVFNLQVPHERLVAQLQRQWPTYVSYVASFLLIGVFWINHHRVCRHIERADRTLLSINLVFLMFVAVIPFPTAMLGEYVRTPEQHVVALIYGATVFVTIVLFDLIWWYAGRSGLIGGHLDPRLRRGMARSYLLGTFVYLCAVALSLVSALASLVLYIVIPALYIATPPFEHLLAREGAGRSHDGPAEDAPNAPSPAGHEVWQPD